jgi:hypothetical protein
LNLAKVGVMLAVNVTGDVLAYRLTGSVAAVAAVTTITLAAGVAAGRLLLPSGAALTAGGLYRAALRLGVRGRALLHRAGNADRFVASSTRGGGSSKSIQSIDA